MFVFGNQPEQRVCRGTFENGTTDHQPWRSDKSEDVCKCPGLIQLHPDLGRGHVARQLVRIETKVCGHAQDRSLFINEGWSVFNPTNALRHR